MNPFEMNTVEREDWKEQCLHWHGIILTGDYCHYCVDWNGLPIDENCMEWNGCVCYPEAEFPE